jgi:porin
VVSGFVQLGAADSRVNRFDGYFGAGLTVTGLVPGRASDELGLAAAIARNGSAYLRSQQIAGVVSQRAESTVELTYLSQVSSRLSLQPSLQYVMHPNTVTGVGNALTLQLRAEVAF